MFWKESNFRCCNIFGCSVTRHRWKFWIIEKIELYLPTDYNFEVDTSKWLENTDVIPNSVYEDIEHQFNYLVNNDKKMARLLNKAKDVNIDFRSGVYSFTIRIYVLKNTLYFNKTSKQRSELLDKLGI